jgi:class 3 adenylate cyclase
MMRLVEELPPEQFGALLSEYQRLLRRVLEETGGYDAEVAFDSALAAFPGPKQAVLAAIAIRRAIATHDWQDGPKPATSIALHSGEAGVGWVGPAAFHCSVLCDTAEGGQIVVSQATAGLLEDQDLGGFALRDLGEQPARRSGQIVRLYELVSASSDAEPVEPSSTSSRRS